jgi:hypothetical protein
MAHHLDIYMLLSTILYLVAASGSFERWMRLYTEDLAIIGSDVEAIIIFIN